MYKKKIKIYSWLFSIAIMLAKSFHNVVLKLYHICNLWKWKAKVLQTYKKKFCKKVAWCRISAWRKQSTSDNFWTALNHGSSKIKYFHFIFVRNVHPKFVQVDVWNYSRKMIRDWIFVKVPYWKIILYWKWYDFQCSLNAFVN